MVYFLVNNNIHLIDAEEHLQNLTGFETALIKIPHKITIEYKHIFDLEFEYSYLIRTRNDFFDIRRTHTTHKRMQEDFMSVNAGDTLIFYTEFEYFNHYLIKLFKDKMAQTIMIDEGFPTYESLLNRQGKRFNFRGMVLQCYFNYILGYTTTSIVTSNNITRPRIADRYIDKVLLYNKVKVERNLQTYLLNKKQYEYNDLNNAGVIFLNEKIYLYYVSMDEYLKILTDILINFSNLFEIIYFKFHPRESEDQRLIIEDAVKKFEKVIILRDDRPVELLINDIGAKFIASFIAQTLLNHSRSNCIVLYLFHKYPSIMRNQIFINLKRLLEALNYNFFEEWSDIKTKKIGFVSETNEENNRNALNNYI